MNILRTVKKNPWTTVSGVLTVVTNVWNLVNENAELLGIGSKTLAIGTAVLTAVMLIYNQFSNKG